MSLLSSLSSLNAERFESPAILKRLASASRKLAELKGIAASIPNQGILINALGLQEAKDSSEIENIVTTTDQLFQYAQGHDNADPATKEALRYRTALHQGFQSLKARPLCTATAVDVCRTLKGVDMDCWRHLNSDPPGVRIKTWTGFMPQVQGSPGIRSG